MILRSPRIPLAGLLLACAAAAFAAPVPKRIDEPVTDRKKFLPTTAYQPRAGKAIGVAVSDVAGMMGREGRSSQADAMGFSADGGSYNWMYVPMDGTPQITNLSVRVGEKGDERVQYPKLGMATLKRVEMWGVKNAYTLVEVEVNGGKGAPADEAFVATKMTVVEGSKAFPLNVDECVASAKSMYKTYQKEHAKELDAELAKAMKDALGDRKATGPRESQDLMHITWMTKDRRLAVTFQSTVTDGAYRNGGGANFDGEVGRGAPGPVGPKPPPPLELGGRWGTQFGMVFGRSYEFDTSGASLGTKTLAAEGFKKELPPPPGARNPPALPVLDPPALPVIPPKKGD